MLTVRRKWVNKWTHFLRVLHVLRPQAPHDAVFGAIVRLYAGQVRRLLPWLLFTTYD